MFAAGCARTIEHGKASQRRNAEIQLVQTVARWTADVAELMPERMADLRAVVDHSLSHPAPLPRKGWRQVSESLADRMAAAAHFFVKGRLLYGPRGPGSVEPMAQLFSAPLDRFGVAATGALGVRRTQRWRAGR